MSVGKANKIYVLIEKGILFVLSCFIVLELALPELQPQ